MQTGRVAGLWSWVPGLAGLRRYDRRWLPHDLTAGVVLAAFMVPVGMGYAEAASLPPITGLYATIVPLVAYAIFGPSGVLVLGPDSSLAPVIAAVIVGVSGGSTMAVDVAGMLAIVTGVSIAAAGLLRLGFVTELLSRPARLGYLAGIAVTIVVGQIPKMLGFSVGSDDLVRQSREVLDAVRQGEVDPTTFAIGAAALVALLVLGRWAPRIPGALVAVVGGIAAVAWLDLAVDTVGILPRGLPGFSVPAVPADILPEMIAAAFAVALVATADTSVLSQSLASKLKDEVDADRELVALGVANAATGFFQGFPISSSASRTPVAMAAGARSQLTPLVGATLVAVMLIVTPGLLRDLPDAVLGAVVVVAAVSLVDLHEIRRLWRMRRVEFALWAAAFLGVALLGVLPGVFVAIVLSLVDFVRRAWRPHDATLVRVDELKGYHDQERHPEGRSIPGLVIYRFDAPLFFANAPFFRREVRNHIAAAEEAVAWVVVAAEPVTDVDTTAADMLGELLDELESSGISLAFAEMKGPVKDRLRDYGLYERVGDERFFPTIGTAVDGYLAASGTPWVDWEERGSGRSGSDRP
ncbi:MAG TPA: SulP family inorganic anion transporter [Actinomycetota bacterium]|nr:SulP family inorganic anion transporter [Actinomycetota bacterium]